MPVSGEKKGGKSIAICRGERRRRHGYKKLKNGSHTKRKHFQAGRKKGDLLVPLQKRRGSLGRFTGQFGV